MKQLFFAFSKIAIPILFSSYFLAKQNKPSFANLFPFPLGNGKGRQRKEPEFFLEKGLYQKLKKRLSQKLQPLSGPPSISLCQQSWKKGKAP